MTQLPARLEFSLSFHVNRLAQALRREQMIALKPFGLTPEQWQILAVLWEQEAVSQSDLAELTLRDEPSVSRMVRTMESNGWVERKIDAADGRTRRLVATAKAWDMRESLLVAFDARLRHIQSQFAPEAVAQLMKQARECADLLEQLAEPETQAEPMQQTAAPLPASPVAETLAASPATGADTLKLVAAMPSYSSGFAEKEIRASVPFAPFSPAEAEDDARKEAPALPWRWEKSNS